VPVQTIDRIQISKRRVFIRQAFESHGRKRMSEV
jgi:hypothetical protein